MSVDSITNALFGTWSGKFNYNVDIENTTVETGCDTLYWNGNSEGGVNIDGHTCKVSDNVPTADDLANGITIRVSEGSVVSITKDELYIADDGLIIADPPVIIVPYDNYYYAGTTIPEKGIYLYNDGVDYISSLTIPGYTGFPHSEHCEH